MNKLLDDLNALCGWECVVKAYDGWRFTLSSGVSAAGAKPFVAFSEVSYVSLPFEFSHPKFREPSPEERSRVASVVPFESEDKLFVVEAETMASLDRQVFFIVATGVEISGSAAQ